MLSACMDNTSIKQENTFNLEVAMQMEKKMLLSELSDSIQCIPLETNNLSLLDDRAYLLYADERFIFVKSKDLLYRFRADGHFLNKIGRRGSAPGEYNMVHSIAVDSIHERLVYYIGQKRVQFWGYDGKFQKEIHLQSKNNVTAVSLLGNNRIISENREYSDDGLKTSIHLFDLDGKLLKEIPIEKDVQKVNLSMHTTPLMYTKGKSVKYKNINANFLFSFYGDSFEQQWKFDLGKYTPSRELLEDVAQKETLMKDFAQMVDIQESDRRFYFLMVHDNSIRGIIVNKKTGELEYSQTIAIPQKGGGLENDYINECYFWPSFISDSNIMYCLLPTEKITSIGEREVKKYSSIDIQLTEDSNPVVLKVYEKYR